MKAGRWLFTFSGWIFAILVFVLDAPSKVNSYFNERDAAWHHVSTWFWNLDRYEGRWTNDGRLRPDENLITDGTTPNDQGDVQLELTDTGTNDFTGEIETSRMEKGLTAWSRVNVSGHVGFGGFRGEIWDVVGGRHRTFAYFRLKPSDKFEGKSLQLLADQNFDRIVPPETILWRTDATMSDGAMGEEFSKILFEISRKNRAVEPNQDQSSHAQTTVSSPAH